MALDSCRRHAPANGAGGREGDSDLVEPVAERLPLGAPGFGYAQ
jgi:hypothetical protein